jgi:hypothetical protein
MQRKPSQKWRTLDFSSSPSASCNWLEILRGRSRRTETATFIGFSAQTSTLQVRPTWPRFSLWGPLSPNLRTSEFQYGI